MVGVPDELDRLWTPHRMAYVVGQDAPAEGYDKPSGCPFCLAPTRPTDQGLVVARGEVVYAVLNLYPYNPGHLLVCPYRHVADYTDLDPAETVELAQFSQTAMAVIRRVSAPAGFNLGLNQGQVSGAGIAAHLHQHIVPRWAGDTNFMPVIGRTKTLPQLLGETRELLAAAWADHDATAGAAATPRRASRFKAPRTPAAPPTPTPAVARKRATASTVDKPGRGTRQPSKRGGTA